MTPMIKARLLPVSAAIAALCLISATAWAVPDYVIAWPKQVHVEKPDPVLGDKLFWEHWVYGEAFARRFKGFNVDKADPELKKGGIQAMVLRIFKTNLWQELNPNYPEQYACHIDVYFDSTIVLAPSTTGKPRKVFPAYPPGITESHRRLEPYAESDKAALLASVPMPANLAKQPVIFSAPLDGRFSAFGVHEYLPNLMPSLSGIVLRSGFDCSVTAPLKEGGAHWLSLHGERPFLRPNKDGKEVNPLAAMGSYTPNVLAIEFDPSPTSESKHYFRVPEAFHKADLPKATLVKVLNWCIQQRNSPSDWRVNGKTIGWQQMMSRCEEAEQHGRILPDPRYHPGKEGLLDTGYGRF